MYRFTLESHTVGKCNEDKKEAQWNPADMTPTIMTDCRGPGKLPIDTMH